MAIQRKTYLDISPKFRQKQVAEVQPQLQAVLRTPGLTEEQRTFAQKQMRVLAHWKEGSLPSEVQGATDYQTVADQLDNPA